MEHLILSRDTTESDIKQRKEIKSGNCSLENARKLLCESTVRLLFYLHMYWDVIARVQTFVLARVLLYDDVMVHTMQYLLSPSLYSRFISLHFGAGC